MVTLLLLLLVLYLWFASKSRVAIGLCSAVIKCILTWQLLWECLHSFMMVIWETISMCGHEFSCVHYIAVQAQCGCVGIVRRGNEKKCECRSCGLSIISSSTIWKYLSAAAYLTLKHSLGELAGSKHCNALNKLHVPVFVFPFNVLTLGASKLKKVCEVWESSHVVYIL